MTATAAHGIALDDVGAGQPELLCIPGWCGNRDVFDPLLPRLSSASRTISVDLPGHGESAAPGPDFGTADVVRSLEAVIGQAGLGHVVPVALSHAGWAGIELARRYERQRVPGLVLIDWMVPGPPPGFMDALAALQDPGSWEQVRAGLFDMWTTGVDVPGIDRYVRDMAGYGFPHWQRAGREIARSFADERSPLEALSVLPEPCPTLHIYATPRDDELYAAQQAYAASHPWFTVHRLDAQSHFPMMEVPEEMASVIQRFVADLP
jgi:pimeloyl-ACP methyl ester carboxylesterase